MPIYIPNREGYYSEAYDIFTKSISSLIHTVSSRYVNITLINNASISEVDDFARNLQNDGKIDTYIKHSVNRGKADSIVGAAKASFEPFITITDADVLFKNGWINEIDRAYENNFQAGVVAPFPAPNLKATFTVSTWLSLNPLKIRFGNIVSDKDLRFFAATLGIPDFFNQRDLSHQFYYVVNRSEPYLIGSGHFVATYRREVFERLEYKATNMGLKGGLRLIEQTVDRLGLRRISVQKYMVHHMGNRLEPWIESEFNNVMSAEPENQILGSTRPPFHPVWTRHIPKALFPILWRLNLYFVLFLQKVLMWRRLKS